MVLYLSSEDNPNRCILRSLHDRHYCLLIAFFLLSFSLRETEEQLTWVRGEVARVTGKSGGREAAVGSRIRRWGWESAWEEATGLCLREVGQKDMSSGRGFEHGMFCKDSLWNMPGPSWAFLVFPFLFLRPKGKHKTLPRFPDGAIPKILPREET